MLFLEAVRITLALQWYVLLGFALRVTVTVTVNITTTAMTCDSDTVTVDTAKNAAEIILQEPVSTTYLLVSKSI